MKSGNFNAFKCKIKQKQTEKTQKKNPKRYISVVRFRFFLVDRGGFEPPKSKTSDLQSDPFGRSGICPILYAFLFRKISVTCRRKGWCLKVESNRRQRDFQSLALPTELSRQDFFSFPDRSSFVLKYYFSTGKRVKKWRPKRGSNS